MIHHDPQTLARQYAKHRGYTASNGWVRNKSGRLVSKGWQDFTSYLFRNQIIDSYWTYETKRVYFIET